MTPLEFALFVVGLLTIVGLVFFLGGRWWERAGDMPHVTPPPAPDPEITQMLDWVREVGDRPAPRGRHAAIAPLQPPPSHVPPSGPVRAYSALAAWQLERDTATTADTSVTKLAARIVDGMMFRDQIDTRGAEILTQLREDLHGERAA